MKPYYADARVTLYQGDALAVLRDLPDESVQMCVTSPPYWGLRDYGTATWEGGDAECGHKAPPTGGPNPARYTPGGGEMFRAANDKLEQGSCRKCGARRIDQQLGLESTPEEYVAGMVAVFRELRRVLRGEGTFWLNVGDSYARDVAKGGSGPNGKHDFIPDYGNARKIMSESKGSSDGAVGRGNRAPVRNGSGNLKPKDLVGIPWMLAFALRADGWYLRSDIIWAKPNPMPESVRDRPTKAHEYLFLLSKSARYYYDQEAIREAAEYGRREWSDVEGNMAAAGGGRGHATVSGGDPSAGRNKRDVWTIATEPYPEAHFATFPTALVKPCILAGSRENDVVLDPFVGSGTSAMVAKQFGRRAIGIDLNPDYLAMAIPRMRQEVFDFEVPA